MIKSFKHIAAIQPLNDLGSELQRNVPTNIEPLNVLLGGGLQRRQDYFFVGSNTVLIRDLVSDISINGIHSIENKYRKSKNDHDNMDIYRIFEDNSVSYYRILRSSTEIKAVRAVKRLNEIQIFAFNPIFITKIYAELINPKDMVVETFSDEYRKLIVFSIVDQQDDYRIKKTIKCDSRIL